MDSAGRLARCESPALLAAPLQSNASRIETGSGRAVFRTCHETACKDAVGNEGRPSAADLVGLLLAALLLRRLTSTTRKRVQGDPRGPGGPPYSRRTCSFGLFPGFVPWFVMGFDNASKSLSHRHLPVENRIRRFSLQYSPAMLRREVRRRGPCAEQRAVSGS